MRVMVIVKATKNSEAGVMPSEKLLADMGKFNEELVKAGVMLAGEGLHPSSKGKRVRFSGGKKTVIDGPFAETKELDRRILDLAGEVHGRGARVGAALPRSDARRGAEIELRPVFEAEDFGKEFTPELRAQEERLRAHEVQRSDSREQTRRSHGGGPHAQAIEAVWRIESARLIGGLVRVVRDVGLAEDLAQEALVTALERWPETGIPDNPGAWLMATAKNRAIDQLRRHQLLERKHEAIEDEATRELPPTAPDLETAIDEDVGDDLLRLVLVACHPVLSTEARVALTLRLLGGLTTEEIARAFLVPEPTIAQRIVRAKRTLAEARVPFEVPRGEELSARLPSVLEVIYLIFNEGYAATRGDDWMRRELCEDALRLGRILAELVPDEAEVHGLVALMELHASRTRARVGPCGEPILPSRSGPLSLGPAAHPARPRGARARRGPRAAARPVHAPGRDRRLPRASAHGRRDRLEEDRRPLRRARRAHALTGRRAEPRRRRRDGVRAGRRARARRRARRRAGAARLPPAAERPRRPPGEARPHRRGPRRVRACGAPGAERARARAAPGASEGVRDGTMVLTEGSA